MMVAVVFVCTAVVCLPHNVFAVEYTLSDLYRIALERSYNVLAIVVEDDAMPLIRETMNMIRKEHPKIGLKTFVLQVEETI
jgi:nitrate reductase NapAB chaperone NapD